MQTHIHTNDQLWSVEDVSQYLRVPARTVRHWAGAKVLRGRKYGKLWKFIPPEVVASARRLGREKGGPHAQ